MSNDLRASVIVDYQNVHLTGHNCFDASQRLARHDTLVDPLLFAQQLIVARNASQRAGQPPALNGHAPRGSIWLHEERPAAALARR